MILEYNITTSVRKAGFENVKRMYPLVSFDVSDDEAKLSVDDNRYRLSDCNYSYCHSSKVPVCFTTCKEFFSSLKLIGGATTFYKRRKTGGDKTIFWNK